MPTHREADVTPLNVTIIQPHEAMDKLTKHHEGLFSVVDTSQMLSRMTVVQDGKPFPCVTPLALSYCNMLKTWLLT